MEERSNGAVAPYDLVIEGARAMGPSGWSEPKGIAVRDASIAAIGPIDANARVSSTRILDGRGKLAIPGFINAHTHTHNIFLRASGDDNWLELHFLRNAEVGGAWDPEDYYAAAALNAIEMVRTGSTSAIDMVSVRGPNWRESMDAVLRAYEDVGLAATVAPVLSDVPFSDVLKRIESAWVPALQRIDELGRPSPVVDQVRRVEGLIRSRKDVVSEVRVGVGLSSPGRASDRLLELAAELASTWNVPIQMHCLESKLDALSSRGPSGVTDIDRLERTGLLGPHVSLVHGVWLTESEADRVASGGAIVVHCPGSNLKLGDGILPVRMLVDRGVRVQLGTDGVASSDNQNMFQAMWLATILSHGVTGDPNRWLKASDVFRIATASEFLNHVRSGRLEVGARADIVLLDADSSFLNPLVDPYLSLVYSEVSRSVRTVVVGGRIVLEDDRLVGVREDAIAQSVNRAWHRLAETAGSTSLVSDLRPHLLRIQQTVARTDYLVQRHQAQGSMID